MPKADSQLVVAMPSCEACAMKRLDMTVLGKMTKNVIILVFPGSMPRQWPILKSSHYRVIVDRGVNYLPDAMVVFAPTCVWLDSAQKVKKAQMTLDADGLALGGSAR